MQIATSFSYFSVQYDLKMTQRLFVDGTWEELAQEMAAYVDAGDDVQPLLEKGQKDEALKKIVTASAVLNSKPERDFLAAYNLLIYLVLQSPNAKMFLPKVCENLSRPVTSSPVHGPGLALSALTTIFNLLPRDSELRFHVFMAIIRFVKQNGLYENLRAATKNVPEWLKQWDADEEQQRKMYEELADLAAEAGDEE